MTDPTFFCGNCALEYDEPYCDSCGKMLVPKVNERATALTAEASVTRATEEGTE